MLRSCWHPQQYIKVVVHVTTDVILILHCDDELPKGVVSSSCDRIVADGFQSHGFAK